MKKDFWKNKDNIINLILLLTIALTAVAILTMGIIIGNKSGDPIGDFMKIISGKESEDTEDFFETDEDDTEDWDDDTTEESESAEDTTIDDSETISDTSDDSTDISTETSDDKETKKPDETTKKSSDTTKKTDETTKKKETTKEKSTTKPIETDPVETTAYETTAFDVSDLSYFSDALFVGDSRTVGLSMYAKIDGASYFARNSMTTFNMMSEKKVATLDNEVISLMDYLRKHDFGKIYIMLGVNELGYSATKVQNKMKSNIDTIHAEFPGVKVIIVANYHTTEERDNTDATINNKNIEALNDKYAELANYKDIFFANMENIYDEPGELHMADGLSRDGVHLYAKQYKLWKQFILEHGRF